MGLISSPYRAHIHFSSDEGDIIAPAAGHACHIKLLVRIYGDDIDAPPCVYGGDIGAPFAAQTQDEGKTKGKMTPRGGSPEFTQGSPEFTQGSPEFTPGFT